MKRGISPFVVGLFVIGAFAFYAFTKIDDPFFNKASQANLAEIEAGKLAESKGSAAVKKLGREMVKDHTVAEHELTDLAKKQSLNIAMNPDAEHKQALQEMAKLSGKIFDSAYMKSQVLDHQVAITLFSEEAMTGVDPSAKQYAIKYLPKLKMHLSMFQGKRGM